MQRPARAFGSAAAGAILLFAAIRAGGLVSAEAPAAAEVDVKVVVTAPAAPLPAGSRGETTLLLTPPNGIHINRYPPVTLKLQAPPGIKLDAPELKQGSPTPIDDPEDFPFKVIEPMKIGFSVDPAAPQGKARVSGKLNFVYCIARSGYCQRTTRDVGFDVTVAPPRTN